MLTAVAEDVSVQSRWYIEICQLPLGLCSYKTAIVRTLLRISVNETLF